MYMVSYVFPWFSTYIIVYAPKIPRPTEHSSSVMIFTLWHILTNCWLYLSYNIFFTLLPNLTTMLSGKMIKKKFHQTPPSNAWNVLTAQDIPPFSVGTSCSVCCATDISKKKVKKIYMKLITHQKLTITNLNIVLQYWLLFVVCGQNI